MSSLAKHRLINKCCIQSSPVIMYAKIVAYSVLHLELRMTNRVAGRAPRSCEVYSLQITKYFEQSLENVITTLSHNAVSHTIGRFL